MTVVVLGGTGFIGARVAHRLVEHGHDVVCLDFTPDAPAVATLRDKVTVVRGDVTDIDDIAVTIRSNDGHRVVHLAYLLNTESAQDSHHAVRVNALGTSNVFEASRLLGVERVVFASSVAVYGDQTMYGERPVTEEDAPSPRGIYATTKLLNEYQAASYREVFGLSVVGIRIGVVFGHGRKRGQGLWAGQFASEPAAGRPVRLPFDQAMRASMIHVDDVAELLVRTLLAPAPRHLIYNSGGDAVSLGQLAGIVRAHVPDADISFGVGMAEFPYLIDSSRAEAEFGWSRPSLDRRVGDHIADARAAVVPT